MERFIDDVLNKNDEKVIDTLNTIYQEKLKEVVFKKLSRENGNE